MRSEALPNMFSEIQVGCTRNECVIQLLILRNGVLVAIHVCTDKNVIDTTFVAANDKNATKMKYFHFCTNPRG